MGIFDTITYYAIIILVIVVFIGAGIGGYMIYRWKFQKRKKETEDTATYGGYRRVDSKSYVPFEDIVDDMLVMDGGRRFVASINCKGFDFFTANVNEQYSTQDGYLSFINLIDNPITLRIDSMAVDLEVPINNHKQALQRITQEIEKAYNDFSNYSKDIDKLDQEKKIIFAKEMKRLQEQIFNKEWQKDHLLHLIAYQEELSGIRANPIREERYLFDWEFIASDFPSDITKEEIIQRAKKELDNKTAQYKSALISAGVKVRRDTTEDLINLCKRYYHPYSSDIFKQAELENSNYKEMVVSSKSYEEAKKKYEDAMADEFLNEFLSGSLDDELDNTTSRENNSSSRESNTLEDTSTNDVVTAEKVPNEKYEDKVLDADEEDFII